MSGFQKDKKALHQAAPQSSKFLRVLNAYCLFHRYRSEPVVAVGRLALNDVVEIFLQSTRDGAGLAIANSDAVHRTDWGDLRSGAAEEDFVRNVEQLARNHLFDEWN